MVQGQVFLKGEGGGGVTHFLFNFFKVYRFYILNYFTISKTVLCKKIFFLSP